MERTFTLVKLSHEQNNARHSGISKKMTTKDHATVETLLSNKQYLSAVQYAYQACTRPYERLHVHVSDFVELTRNPPDVSR